MSLRQCATYKLWNSCTIVAPSILAAVSLAMVKRLVRGAAECTSVEPRIEYARVKYPPAVSARYHFAYVVRMLHCSYVDPI